MYELKRLSREEINSLRGKKTLPYSLYNREGQILIHKTERLSVVQLERILRFVDQGIYHQSNSGEPVPVFNAKEDEAKIPVQTPAAPSDTRLLSKHHLFCHG